MPILTTAPSDRSRLVAGDANGTAMVVVALCAAWCNTCAEYRAGLQPVAARRPGITFVWLDIEDDCAVCGDIEVENFPTLIVFRGDDVLHYGVSAPQPAVAARLIDALAARGDRLQLVPQAVRELRRALLTPGGAQ